MVGERIRYYRKRQKMTLRELGEKSGFENRGDVRIAQYENGSRVPRTGTLNRIAKALGIPPEEFKHTCGNADNIFSGRTDFASDKVCADIKSYE